MGRVLVAGSINMDIVARAARFPRSARPWRAANSPTSLAAKAQTRPSRQRNRERATALIGRLGDDASGRELEAFLSQQGVDLST